jgi:hypothetical protein
MNDMIINNLEIKDMIYEIRGRQVMLDFDLAKVYQCTNGTKDINKAVNRNIEKFPSDFYFRLNNDEYYRILRFQSGTSKLSHGGRRYNPYVFTEQGVAMLASVLHTDIAIQSSIKIMRAFVYMRHHFDESDLRLSIVESKLLKHDFLIDKLLDCFKIKEMKLEKIIFDGQEYDAYSLLLNIISYATNEIIIFDNYMNNKILDMIDKNINVILVRNSNIKDEVVDKYLKQYNNLKVVINDNIHDRYIIIDRKLIYYIGASLKDIGKKCFSICSLDSSNIELIINRYINNVL